MRDELGVKLDHPKPSLLRCACNDGVMLVHPLFITPYPAKASTVRNNTSEPLANCADEVNSAGLWLMPARDGTKIMPA